MGPSGHHLGRAKIARLLAAIGSTHAPEPAPPAAALYDWRDPHTFNVDQRNRLTQTLGQVAARMAEVFVRSGGGDVKVSLKTCTQHLAGDLCRRLERAPKRDPSRLGTQIDEDFCMTFAPEKGPPCGFVAIAPQTARAWATWLLGDSDSSHAPGRDLSALEESLLSDLLTRVLDAFLAPLRTQHHLNAAGSLCQGQPNLQFELTEEVTQIVFEVKTADQDQPSTVTVLLPCSLLAALAGKTAPAEAAKVSPQELPRTLMEHLQNVPVTVMAVLASTTLTFQEALELGPGDILLLDKPVEGLAHLVLDGRTVLHGRPARAEGEHALVIVESESGPGRPRAAEAPQTRLVAFGNPASPPANQRKDAKGNA